MMKHREAIVVAGGDFFVDSLADALPDLQTRTPYIVAADAGTTALLEIGIVPDVAIGDFDTAGRKKLSVWKELGIEVVCLPPEKEVTDTHAAMEYLLSKGISHVHLFGALGGSRVDHLLANIQLLEWCSEHEMDVKIYDRFNVIQLLSGRRTARITYRKKFPYLSLLPVSREVRGIHLQSVKYPLKNETLIRGFTRGISNQLVADATEATISIQQGKLLIIQSRDGKNVSLF